MFQRDLQVYKTPSTSGAASLKTKRADFESKSKIPFPPKPIPMKPPLTAEQESGYGGVWNGVMSSDPERDRGMKNYTPLRRFCKFADSLVMSIGVFAILGLFMRCLYFMPSLVRSQMRRYREHRRYQAELRRGRIVTAEKLRKSRGGDKQLFEM